VVLKPSELSPFTALLFAQVMHDAGAPRGCSTCQRHRRGGRRGDVEPSGRRPGLVHRLDPRGVLVAQAAAPTVKRVVQELGGKSPNVFLPDADFASAVPKGVLGLMRNVGQSCASPTRMVVPAARLAEVEALAADAANAIVVGDPLDEATVLGPLANAPQFAKVQELIQSGSTREPSWSAAGRACRRGSITAILPGRRSSPRSPRRCALRRRRSSARSWC
jgi:aldehyde dehydrogenase (NAD+)